MARLNEDAYRNSFELKMLNVLRESEIQVFSDDGRMNEPRLIAENVQEIVRENCVECFEKDLIKEIYTYQLSRRNTADMKVVDCDGVEYRIDVKTHNLGAYFNMPNITSMDRLSRLYSRANENYCFMLLLVEYEIDQYGVNFRNVSLFLLENIAWECLRIGAVGAGQIQIKDVNDLIIDYRITRDEWMQEFFQKSETYCTIEIEKAERRREHMRRHAAKWHDK